MRLVGCSLILLGLLGLKVWTVQPPAEGAMGQCQPVEKIVGMTGDPAPEIRGVIEAADHELSGGSLNIGRLTLIPEPGSEAYRWLMRNRGQTVDVHFRVVEPPTLQEIKR